MKKLTRSNDNKVFAGVMGGLGEYFDVDPVVFRLLFVLLLLGSGVFPGILLYIIAVLVIPESPRMTPSKPESAAETPAADTDASTADESAHDASEA